MEPNETTETQSAEIGKLAEALAAAQADITGALKTSENPFFKSRYADLATVMEACRAPLSKHGLAVIQTTEGGTDTVTIVTTLAHASNQWIRGRLTMKPVKADPQTLGSCITYGRRYTLAAMVGVAPEDDDGNLAAGKMNDGKTDAERQTTDTRPEKKVFQPKPRPTPSVAEMLKTGQAVAVPPVATAEKVPPKLQTLMELSGVTLKELHGYLEGKDWLKPGAPISTLNGDIYEKMIEDANWTVVANKIKTARKV